MLLVRRLRFAFDEKSSETFEEKKERKLDLHFISIIRQMPVRDLLMHIRFPTRRISRHRPVFCSADVRAKQANAYLFKASVLY
jgi:hypothetical protein